jgi:hypothetical protein
VGTTTGEILDERCATEIGGALSSSLDNRWANFRAIDPSRMPFVYQSIDGFFKPLNSLIVSTVSILRWRSGLSEGLTEPFRSRREQVSQDGETWLEVHSARRASIIFGLPFKPIEASTELEQQIAELVSERSEEPLGHQLLREAWNESASHPRSALVIGVAAAEVGLRKLIGTLSPDKSRPAKFSTMLRKSLPLLRVKGKLKGKKIIPPAHLIERLQSAARCRNKAVHEGEAPPGRKDLEEMLRAVSDFLWICDLYAGDIWAAEYISLETHAAWENE